MNAVRCSCYRGLPDVSTARFDQATTPEFCPVHGQRTPRPATCTDPLGEDGDVPVVDLTATINGIRQHAIDARARARSVLEDAHHLAVSFRREADYLDSLADVLLGHTGGDDRDRR